jgi:hypothetical protein
MLRTLLPTFVLLAAATAAPPGATHRPVADPGESMTLGGRPAATARPAVMLFDGSDFGAWRTRDGAPCPWPVQDDGSVRAGGGDAVTSRSFGDFQLHLEFLCPLIDDAEGQARANSGVYLHGRYEVQVLDTFGREPAMNGCGAIYSIAPPDVNAARPAGQWQTYDIVFRAPRFDADGGVAEPARVTVLHNGAVIHNNLELPTVTPGGLDDVVVPEGPVLLQDHGDPVRYRNIWIRPL